MTRPVVFVTAALVALAPGRLPAQERLTLDRAVQETLARNASLRAARAASAAESARAREARSAWFPRVSVTESWQRGDQPVFVFSSLLSARRFAASNFVLDTLNHPEALGFFRTSVGVEQLLFDGGGRRSAVQIAAIRQDISELAVEQAAADLALSATRVFGRVLVAEAGRRAASAALDAAREERARAERRRDAGLVTDADVLALAVHAADLQQRAIQFEGDAAVARAELNRLMGAAVSRDFEAVEPPIGPKAAGADATLDRLLAEAEAARPELRRAAAVERLADAGRTQARAALVPQVAAQAVFDTSGTRLADRTSSWLVGGELRWNLSLGGAEIARLNAATEARAQARAEAQDQRAAIQVEVATALRRLEAAVARQVVGRAAVDQARESERIVRNRFNAGVAGITDFLRASSAVLDADAQRVSAAVDAIVSDAMLRRALGRHP